MPERQGHGEAGHARHQAGLQRHGIADPASPFHHGLDALPVESVVQAVFLVVRGEDVIDLFVVERGQDGEAAGTHAQRIALTDLERDGANG